MLQRTDWNPDYTALYRWRHATLIDMSRRPQLLAGALAYYKTRPAEFISHWVDTADPRNTSVGKPAHLPLVLFPRQVHMVEFLHACLAAEANGLIEKSRDMGATWTACSFSVWLWLFQPGSAVGWGSRKADLVDQIGVMDSIFEKVRTIIRGLPRLFWPAGFSEEHMAYMRVINPASGSTIIGESGDNIGRGGRTTIYLKDESAHYERPEAVEAALLENTRCQIDMSSVHGMGSPFHRKREAGLDWEPGRPAVRGRTNVLVLDWREHPGKTQGWYDEKRREAEDNGLLHVFYQEVDRNYAASVEGIIIPPEWVQSAIDAHLKIKKLDEGQHCAALDVADGGGDRNALALRKGVVLQDLQEWGERDTGATARRTVKALEKVCPIDCNYDCIGVGSGIKAEANRLGDEKLVPRGLQLVPWDAGAAPSDPDLHVVENDGNSPLNKDFYLNRKAQGWWMLRRRFEKTHRAITEGVKFPPDELISIPSTLPRLQQLRKELSQPTTKFTARLKLMVDKAPEGTRSPNLGDAVMMCYHPLVPAYDPTLSWL